MAVPDRSVSSAFFLACSAFAATHGKPLPKGLLEVEVGEWRLALNTGAEPVPFRGQQLAPFMVYAENTVFVGFALFGPFEGMIGGLSEDRLIADFATAGFTVEGELER